MKKFICGAVLCFCMFGMARNAHANLFDDIGGGIMTVLGAAAGTLACGPWCGGAGSITAFCIAFPEKCK